MKCGAASFCCCYSTRAWRRWWRLASLMVAPCILLGLAANGFGERPAQQSACSASSLALLAANAINATARVDATSLANGWISPATHASLRSTHPHHLRQRCRRDQAEDILRCEAGITCKVDPDCQHGSSQYRGASFEGLGRGQGRNVGG